MKKTIVHHMNDCDPLIAHMIIGRLLLQHKSNPKPIDTPLFVDNYQGYRVQFIERKTSVTFYIENLEI